MITPRPLAMCMVVACTASRPLPRCERFTYTATDRHRTSSASSCCMRCSYGTADGQAVMRALVRGGDRRRQHAVAERNTPSAAMPSDQRAGSAPVARATLSVVTIG